MKNLCISFLPTLCLALSSTAYSHTVPYQAVIRAELFAKQSANYTGGSILLDGRKNTMELTLQPQMPECAEGMMCAQMMPEALSYSLGNSRTDMDNCGILRTYAKFDQRPVDGIYLSVVATNNTHNTCPTFIALPAFEVKVKMMYTDRMKGEQVIKVDTFEADEIALIKPVK